MGERPTYPTQTDVIRALIEQHSLDLHVARPGRVQSYDATTQTADVVPLIRHQVPQPDGTYTYEELPVIPSVPVVFPRAGSWFLAFSIRPGDTVQLLMNDCAIGHWRTGDGSVANPQDLRRHHIAHAVAIPGLLARGQALRHPPPAEPPTSASACLTLGSDDDAGTRVSIYGDKRVVVTQGTEVVLQIDTDGTVHIGGAAGQFVALANLVKARLDTIQSAFDGHVHAVTGTTAAAGAPIAATILAPAHPIGTLADVAATKAKAT